MHAVANDRQADCCDRLLSAASHGHSPESGPRLTRAEVELLRTGEGPVCAAVLRARAAQWALMEAEPDERDVLRATAEAVDQELSVLEAELFERNDTSSRELYAAHAALKRALGAGVDLVALSSENEESLRAREAQDTAARARAGEELLRNRELEARARKHKPTPAKIAVLTGSLAGAVVLAWAITPAPLREAPKVPPASALSSRLGLTDLRVVGSIVFASCPNWKGLGSEERERLAGEACAKTRGLGFSGLVLFDATNDRVSTCAPSRSGD